ncbi:MAG: peroxiredoxin [Candidatus Hodarchaeota archaeon]
MLKIGDKAPDFTAMTSTGEEISLSALKGKKYVLYFYPKDNTPGCTAEACSIRDNYNVFLNQGIPVFGVSGGSVQSHERFREKYNLPFPLLMDEKFELAKKYNAWGRGNRVKRITYLINEEGKIEEIFGLPDHEKVKPKEHAQQIINFWELEA